MSFDRKFVATACMKNEGSYILEWVAYHRIIGFDKVVVASNDNTDGSGALLDALHQEGEIVHIENSVPSGKSPQLHGLRRIFESGHLEPGDVVASIDADEFLFMESHKNVHEFFESFGSVDGIAIPWRHFGSGGREQYSPSLVIDRFRRCTKLGSDVDNHFKSLFVVKGEVNGIGVHRPHYIDGYSPVFCDPSGRRVPDEIARGALPSAVDFRLHGHDVAQLNHYAIKSYDEYSLRTARGNGFNPARPDHFDRTLDKKDDNSLSDDRMERLVGDVLDEIGRLQESSSVASAQRVVEGEWGKLLGQVRAGRPS